MSRTIQLNGDDLLDEFRTITVLRQELADLAGVDLEDITIIAPTGVTTVEPGDVVGVEFPTGVMPEDFIQGVQLTFSRVTIEGSAFDGKFINIGLYHEELASQLGVTAPKIKVQVLYVTGNPGVVQSMIIDVSTGIDTGDVDTIARAITLDEEEGDAAIYAAQQVLEQSFRDNRLTFEERIADLEARVTVLEGA